MSALQAREHGATYRVVRAKRGWWCGDNHAAYPRTCTRRILPGEQYVRAVMFPSHECYSYVDRLTYQPLNKPIVSAFCLECADQYSVMGDLARAARDAS